MTDPAHAPNGNLLPAGISSAAPNCPLEKAINTIGGRWKMLVLRVLFLDGEQRFNALLHAIPGISAKVAAAPSSLRAPAIESPAMRR